MTELPQPELSRQIKEIAMRVVAEVNRGYDLLDEATLDAYTGAVEELARAEAEAAGLPASEVETAIGVAYSLALHERASARWVHWGSKRVAPHDHVEHLAQVALDEVIEEIGAPPDDLKALLAMVRARAAAMATADGLPEFGVQLTQARADQMARNRWEAIASDREAWKEMMTNNDTEPAASTDISTLRPSVRRINVNFSEQAYQTLEGLAHKTGKSMSDVLRDAIALKAWFEQTRAEGGHVLVERPDGKVREIISV